jgi:hypothetical protein
VSLALGSIRTTPRNQEFLSDIKGLGQNDPCNQEFLRDIKVPYFGIGEDGEILHEHKEAPRGFQATSPLTSSPGPFFLPTSTTVDLEL